jgi:hypothetical protein
LQIPQSNTILGHKSNEHDDADPEKIFRFDEMPTSDSTARAKRNSNHDDDRIKKTFKLRPVQGISK